MEVANFKNMENGQSDSEDSSSNSEDIDTNDDASAVLNRRKRSVNWCREPAPSSSSYSVSWPPANPSSDWRRLRHVRLGNPLFGTKMQLYSMTQQNLAVYPDNKVRGTSDDSDLHTYLELTAGDHPGHVRIRGLLTNLFVAMDKKGRLYGEPNIMEESTVFIESFQGSYNTYLSRKYAHLGWYIGLKRSGKFKKGPKTRYGQKAIKFLPRRSRFE